MAGDAERRYIIGSGWQTVAVSASGIVTAADVDSDGAANGEVLTADGAGAATWEAGGGGSLPAWWTVDSTPGSESVHFAGKGIFEPPTGVDGLSVFGNNDGSSMVARMTNGTTGAGLAINPDGSVDFSDGAIARLSLPVDTGSTVFRSSDGDTQFALGANAGDPTLGFFGGAPAVQQTLDPSTASPEDIANALIASTLMAAG